MRRGPLSEKEKEERKLKRALEKAERQLAKHQQREDKELLKLAEREARSIVKAASPRNASKLPADDLQVGSPAFNLEDPISILMAPLQLAMIERVETCPFTAPSTGPHLPSHS